MFTQESALILQSFVDEYYNGQLEFPINKTQFVMDAMQYINKRRNNFFRYETSEVKGKKFRLDSASYYRLVREIVSIWRCRFI